MKILVWYTGLIIIILVFTFNIIISSAQPDQQGFYSIDCGSTITSGTYFDSIENNNITWTPDTLTNDSVAKLGKSISLGDNYQIRYRTIRYFPDEGNYTKYCYTLGPVQEGSIYIVRADFYMGNTSGVYNTNVGKVSFTFIIDSYVASDVVITLPQQLVVRRELYVKANTDKIFACVARGLNDPFISSIELRPLSLEEYGANLVSSLQHPLLTITRGYFPNSSQVFTRYPNDKYDRIWSAFDVMKSTISTPSNITISNSFDAPPLNILQTSWEPNFGVGKYDNIYVQLNDEDEHMYLHVLYFAEINQTVNKEGMRVFDVGINNTGRGSKKLATMDIFKLAGGNFKAYALANLTNASGTWMNTTFSQLATSEYPPIISAIEILQLLDFTFPLGTTYNDVNAIESLIVSFSNDLTDYVGDPCLPGKFGFPWLSCNNIGNLTHITRIDLSSFGLVGEIPTSLGNLTYLTTISFHENNLTGEIPNLASLLHLEVLDLSNNKLTGPVPNFLSMLPSLKVLNLENNNLSGPIPSGLLDKNGLDFKYLGNAYLCSSCSNSSSSSHLTPLIIGVVIGAIFIATLLIVIFFYYRQRSSSSQLEHDVPLVNAQDFGERINKANTYTYKEIVEATNNFTTILGHGGSGDVYKGKLANGLDVAIKVLMVNDIRGLGIDEFKNEASLLTTVHHKKIVQLLGYCIDQKLALVYELMPNGSLFSILFGSNIFLDWIQRLTIVLDVAQGLDYLHNQCHKPIIHRDIKSRNILLDNNFNGKVADLGISKDNGGPTRLMGTLGYIDPEYGQSLHLTSMVDIYSFGVLLLEVITGKPALISPIKGEEMSLVEWVKPFVQTANLEELVDKRLKYKENAMWIVVDIAIQCTKFNSSERPQNMGEIVTCISEALRIESKDAYNDFTDSPRNTTSSLEVQLSARRRSMGRGFHI